MATRFSILTTVHSAVPDIHRLLARYGAADICSVRAAGTGVAAAASDTERKILSAVREAVDKDGAKAILLGSGGLTGRANDLEQLFGIPVMDGVAAAIKMAEGLFASGAEFSSRVQARSMQDLRLRFRRDRNQRATKCTPSPSFAGQFRRRGVYPSCNRRPGDNELGAR
jgi:hypothetical protein